MMIHAQATVQLNAAGGLHWQADTNLISNYRAQVAQARRSGQAIPCDGPNVLNPSGWPHYDITPKGQPPRSSEVFVIRGQLFLRESKSTANTTMSHWFALGPARLA